MTFYIYCPCRVARYGLAGISGNAAYVFWPRIKERSDRAKCKHCGEVVRIYGDDKSADRSAGLKGRRVRLLLKHADRRLAAIRKREGAST